MSPPEIHYLNIAEESLVDHIFQCSEVAVSSVVTTDSNLSKDVGTIVEIAVVVGELVSVMVSSLRLVLVVIGRHS